MKAGLSRRLWLEADDEHRGLGTAGDGQNDGRGTIGGREGQQVPVAVVNPRRVRAFARATGRLAKTDRLDAATIARFAEAVRPPVRPLPDEATRHLGALVARRRQLLEMLVAERNRRHAADPALHEGIDAHLRWLGEALDGIERDLDAAVRESAVWRAREGLLPSVPGVGPISARTLLAELPEL